MLWLWLIIFVVFLVIEILTVSFGAIFISISSLICLGIFSFVKASIKVQLLTFLVLLLISLFGFRNFIMKRLKIESENSAAEIEKNSFVREVAKKRIDQLGRIAKESTTLIVSQDLSDTAKVVSNAMNVFEKTKSE